jgi:hypothetical protein
MVRRRPGLPGTNVSYPERVQKWAEALGFMCRALRLLDESGAPPDVGAHLDLARHHLSEAIEAPDDT